KARNHPDARGKDEPRPLSELELVLDRGDAGLGAGFVAVAAGRARNADAADDRTARFDEEPTADGDDTRQLTHARLHHAGAADRLELRRAGAEAHRRPCLAARRARRVRPRETVAQHDLCHAEAVDDRDRNLEAALT